MMNAQVSVNPILNRLSHYVSRISAYQLFQGRSLSKIQYVN